MAQMKIDPTNYEFRHWNKPLWAFDSYEQELHNLPINATLQQYYKELKTAIAERRNNGQISKELPGLFRQERFVKGDINSGIEVHRANSISPSIRYFNPLQTKHGSNLAVLVAEYQQPDSAPTYQSHLGEEFVFLLSGSMDVELLTPDSKNRELIEKTSHALDVSNKERGQSIFFRSEIPHRGIVSDQSVKMIIFYSAPLGEHSVFGFQNRKLVGPGSRKLTGLEDQQTLWAVFSGIGARIERRRRERGLTSTTLAQECGIPISHLTKIENGAACPKLKTVLTIASRLDVPPHELLPDDAPVFCEGCYTSKKDRVDKSLEEITKQVNSNNRLLVPFRWHDCSDALVYLGGSPWAKSMLPMILYVGENQDWADIDKRIGAKNKATFDNHTLRHQNGKIVFLIIEGAAEFELANDAEDSIFIKDEDDVQDADRMIREKGDLLYVDAQFLRRIRVHDHCKMLAVTWKQEGISRAVSIATNSDLQA